MANISKIQLPDGSTYNLKDSSSLHSSFDASDTSSYLRHDGQWIDPNFEIQSNKITEFNSSVTDVQYPSAKLVYDTIKDNEIVTAIAINDLTENKQDKLTAGENITIDASNVISATSVDISGKEDSSNKVTVIDENSTDVQYPSAKAVYDVIIEDELIVAEAINELDEHKEDISNKITEFDASVTDVQYPSAKLVYDTITDVEETMSIALNTLNTTKQDMLIAGENITIDASNVISAVGGSVEGKEDVSNKVTLFDSSSTDIQYPSAKLVYDTFRTNELVVSAAFNQLNDSKQDKLVAGPNIIIDASNVISAVGSEMTDEKTLQTSTVLNSTFPLLLKHGEGPEEITDGVLFNTSIYANPYNGSVTAQRFYEVSDIRKKNVLGEIDLNMAYEMIDKCSTILYTLKDDKSSEVQIGSIAQEVKEFFPEIVSTDKNGFLSIDYSRLTIILMRALKDIINRINVLEQR